MRRRRNQSNMFLFGVFTCLLCVMTVGYAAFNTKLELGAKGNVFGKSGMTTNELKDKAVTSGDGLYKDTYEEGRYVYKGANPNNYITFNNELWRIIAIEKDGAMKIVRKNKLGDNMAFDPDYYIDIPGVTSSKSIEGTRYTDVNTDYCYNKDGQVSSYHGCTVWGSKTTMLDSSGSNITKMPRIVGNSTTYDLPEKEAYINTYLNSTWFNTLDAETKSMIEKHAWNVGVLDAVNGQTLEQDLVYESAYKWRGNVGLINITDYVKSNTNKESCGNVYTVSSLNRNLPSCNTTTWLYNSSYTMWTINIFPLSSDSDNVWCVSSAGYINGGYPRNTFGVVPALYLKPSITLSGEGTESTPYTISIS